jgi:chaperonin cofactor prefoldin
VEEKEQLQQALENFLAAAQTLDTALEDAKGSNDKKLAELADETLDRLGDAHDYESVGDELSMALDFLKKL